MESATVTIKEVTDKGNGWFEVALDGDDKVLSTKSTTLAELANASVGGEAVVEFNSRTKGKFTDHYLESVNGEKGNGAAKPAAKKPASRAITTAAPGGKSQDTQERIARQWAFGRATELLIASDREFSFPLDADTAADLKLQASALLDATRN